MRFAFETLPVRVRFGAGTAGAAIAAEADRLGLRRILLIATERELARSGGLADDLGALVVARFTGVRPHVPVEVAERARAAAEKHAVDGLLAIGGGSTTGVAKAVALTGGQPIIAVPTTYAGSEMTPVWGLTADGRKQTGTDPRVLPRSVVYDSDLLAALPDAVAVPSALNALAHCVEAFWGPRANPVLDTLAAEGIAALRRGLREDDREALLYGSFLAGHVFAGAGSGLHHKICHVLGGAFDLPHAPLHAVVLPWVMEFNAPAVPAAAGRIAAALAGSTAAAELRDLAAKAGAPRTLHEIGLRPDQLPAAIEAVMAALPIANPREVTRESVAAILRSAYGPS